MDKKIRKRVFIIASVITFILILIYREKINYKDNNDINPIRSESTMILNDYSGVTMTAKRVADTKIAVNINNSADESLTFGEDYILEVKEGNKWYSLPAGQYRIIKGFSIELQQETPKEYFISVEFSI